METSQGLALSTRFLEAYNRLDNFMRRTLSRRPGANHGDLLAEMAKRDALFRSSLYELEGFARLRNAIVHNPLAADAKPIAEPHADVVEKYESLVRYVLDPPNAFTIAVPLEKIFTTDWSESVLHLVQLMQERVYTHVPILEKESVVGVFSENTLFFALAAERRIAIDSATKVNDLRRFVPLSGRADEAFEFLSMRASVAAVAARFQENFHQRKRLGAIFLTENGEATEGLRGLITAWDVAGLQTPLR
jgi:CBS domain-containing protein